MVSAAVGERIGLLSRLRALRLRAANCELIRMGFENSFVRAKFCTVSKKAILPTSTTQHPPSNIHHPSVITGRRTHECAARKDRLGGRTDRIAGCTDRFAGCTDRLAGHSSDGEDYDEDEFRSIYLFPQPKKVSNGDDHCLSRRNVALPQNSIMTISTV